jgi:ABC-type nickel/cobalt efflux system permease component RcnA
MWTSRTQITGFGFVTVVLLVVPCCALEAHPVPRRCHDRTITVRLSPAAIEVDYRLEVDEFTVVFDDLPALGDQVDLRKLHKPQEFYETFARQYAPILAANLIAKLDGRPLEFHCVKHAYTLRDENGNPLDHLRCDFVFRAKPAFVDASGSHTFTFKEANYELEEGQIRLSLTGMESINLQRKIEPDATLQTLPATQLQPGDDAKLRKAEATFTIASTAERPGTSVPEPFAPSAERRGFPSLYELFRDTQYGFWALLCLAAAFGAAHALTPGHGKTLVAAYLVGERGTVAHAFLLGLVTTLTHTGVVIALALALRIYFPYGGMSDTARQDLQMALGLGGGLLVAGLGFWLLLRRLSGQADHFHLGSHGHHHHHDHGHPHAEHSHHHAQMDHYHDEQGHVHPLPGGSQPVSWWGLVLLGVSGGIVPCWDAILMLLVAVSTNLLWLALPMLLAFSAGLAGVLIAIGILVVRVKGFAGSRWGQSRLFRALPILSALLVTALGLWLCYGSVHANASGLSRH